MDTWGCFRAQIVNMLVSFQVAIYNNTQQLICSCCNTLDFRSWHFQYRKTVLVYSQYHFFSFLQIDVYEIRTRTSDKQSFILLQWPLTTSSVALINDWLIRNGMKCFFMKLHVLIWNTCGYILAILYFIWWKYIHVIEKSSLVSSEVWSYYSTHWHCNHGQLSNFCN